MLCPKCKKMIPDGSRFCLECGSAVSSDSQAEAAQAAARADLSLGATPTLTGPAAASAGIDASLGDQNTMQGAGSAAGARPIPGSGVSLTERYELEAEIGRGGFAVVWKARDRRLGRTVAVKRLLSEATQGPGAVQTAQRFEREAQAIATLNHRNIVQVFDSDADADGRYIVMEYVSGGTLREYLKKRGKLPVAEAVALAMGLCRGIAAAHRQGLVHRDVKPANVLLDPADAGGPVPRLVDFGLARQGRESDVSATGYGLGTPYYMAPEQRRDAKSVTHTADIYALGKTLYEMVTGEVPDSVDPSLIPPPEGLGRIILKCIRSHPAERYFSADDLLRDLEALGTGGAVQVSGASAAGGTACPSCTRRNPTDAEFCEACGTGLMRRCPECDRENALGLRFCGGCGTDVPGFLQARDALARMQSFAKELKWSRVTKEYGLLAEGAKLPGEKGRQLLADLRELAQAAGAAEQKLGEMRGRLAEAVAAREFEQAQDLCSQILELVPADAETAALGAELSDAAALRQLLALRHEFSLAVGRREFIRAKSLADEATALVAGMSAPDRPSPLLRDGAGKPVDKPPSAVTAAMAARVASEILPALAAARRRRWLVGAVVATVLAAAVLGWQTRASLLRQRAITLHDQGLRYASDTGDMKDEVEAARCFRKAAELGYAPAQISLAECYALGTGVVVDDQEAVGWVREAAGQGHAEAQLLLGLCYQFGTGVAKDEQEAARWVREAAEQGCAEAQVGLADCYGSGTGVAEDKAEMVKWYRKAAELGDTSAQCGLGHCYASGTGVTKDDAEAVKWYRKAAEQGSGMAQWVLGTSYADGTGVAKDEQEAVRWVRKAAEWGWADAQVQLGDWYGDGTGVVKDETEKVRWYRKAAELDRRPAQCKLGLCYANGTGVTKDDAEAIRWFSKAFSISFHFYNGDEEDTAAAVKVIRKAAEGNLAEAQYLMGRKCDQETMKSAPMVSEQGTGETVSVSGRRQEHGEVVANDEPEAVKWYRKAAEQGHALAQEKLGSRYSAGTGVTKDPTEAAKWYAEAAKGYRIAAEQGAPSAQFRLGSCYAEGRGVARDEVEAVKWYRKAAEQGDADAQFSLGQCYSEGRGVTKDGREAVNWYRKAGEGRTTFSFDLDYFLYQDWWYSRVAEQRALQTEKRRMRAQGR